VVYLAAVGPLRRLVPALALVCTVGLVAPASPVTAADPRPGAAGIGDPYFPLDGNGGIDVLHYDIQVAYDLAAGRLRGDTRVTLRATRALTRFNLDLLLPVQSVRIDGAPVAFRKPDQHELQVTPAAPLRKGQTVQVAVAYDGHPAPITYAGEQNWIADEHEVVAMNQPHMAPWWFPANDHPRDRARFDVRISVPSGLDVVGNGTLVGRTVAGPLATTHWRSAEPMASYLAFFAAGSFRTASGTHRGLPWYVAVSERLDPAQQSRAMRLMKQTPAITAWLTRRLGRYPFSSTGGLTTALPVGFALENQTRPTYPVLDHGGTSTVVHEMAHQWFGNSVTVRGWRDIWLNEGPATFFEVLWAEKHGGPSGREWLDRAYRDLRANDYFWRVRIHDPGPGHLFDVPIYQRGAMTMQALRSRIGGRDFNRLLRTWVRTHRGGTGTTRQFVALAERVSGEELGRFFRAWLRAPRPPARTRANGL